MIQKKYLLGLLLVPSLLLSACSFDLGTFEKNDSYESYYEAIGDVRAKYDNETEEGAEDTYNVHNSLFNDTTVNKLDWEKEEYKVVERNYLYVILTFNEVLKVESIALYLKSSTGGELNINAFYYVNDALAPHKIMFYSSPSETGEGEPIVYDDPPIEDANVSLNVSLSKETWKGVTFSKFRQVGYEDENLHTGSNSVLYIRIEENSGHNRATKSPIQFTFLNLLIRAVE